MTKLKTPNTTNNILNKTITDIELTKSPIVTTIHKDIIQEAKEFVEAKPKVTVTSELPRDKYNLRSPNINLTGKLYTRTPPPRPLS